MKAITNIVAGGVAIAALTGAAPAAAQYVPGDNYPYGYGSPAPVGGYGTYGDTVPGPGSYGTYGYGAPDPSGAYGAYGYGVPGPAGGYGSFAYGVDRQAAVNQCASAVQGRLSGGYNYGYGYNGGYGGGRVLGISRVDPLAQGGVVVRGVATSGRYGGGYGYAPSSPVDLVWRCRTDFRGFVVDLDVSPAQRNYGYDYAPRNDDYSQYGYQRY